MGKKKAGNPDNDALLEVDGWVVQSEAERDCILELRERLADIAGKGDETHDVTTPVLARYARARFCNANKAEKMFRATHKWRGEVKPIEIAKSFEPSNLIKTFRPGGFLGVDKYGCPVFYDRLGNADPAVLGVLKKNPPQGKDVSPADQLRDFEIQKQEVLTEVFKSCSEKHGRQIYQTIVINDLRGLGKHHLTTATLEIVKALLGTLDDHYPLRFRVLYVVNAPWIINVAWKMIQPFIHETTRRQVKILSGDPSATLLKEINADQLPKALGGNLVINGDPYCNPPIVKGGRLKDYPNFEAGPSHYRKENDDLPMQLYVKARQSVRIGAAPKAEEEGENTSPAESEEEPQNLFAATVSLMSDWVENLQSVVQGAVGQTPEQTDQDEEEEEGSPIADDLEAGKAGATASVQDVTSAAIADAEVQNSKCCCIIS